MLAGGRAMSIVMMFFAVSPAAAQVINGESTYGDSDLHQPPAATVPDDDAARHGEQTRQPRDAPERR